MNCRSLLKTISATVVGCLFPFCVEGESAVGCDPAYEKDRTGLCEVKFSVGKYQVPAIGSPRYRRLVRNLTRYQHESSEAFQELCERLSIKPLKELSDDRAETRSSR